MKDERWKLVYDASTAGRLSNTFESSNHDADVQYWLESKGAIGVVFMVDTITVSSASEIRLTPKHRAYKDGGTSKVTTYPTKSDKSEKYLAVDTDLRELDPWFFQTCAPEFTVEPWLDAADSRAKCKIWAKRIYPQT